MRLHKVSHAALLPDNQGYASRQIEAAFMGIVEAEVGTQLPLAAFYVGPIPHQSPAALAYKLRQFVGHHRPLMVHVWWEHVVRPIPPKVEVEWDSP